MTHKKNSINEFLLSLIGKGWLWGTGKVITVNPEYAHLLQEQSNYNVSPSPFERQFKTKEGLPEMEVLREESLHITEENDNKNKEYLTEIDFMCAWLDIFLCLPHECDLVFCPKGVYREVSVGKRTFRIPFFWVSVKEDFSTMPDIEFKDCPDIESSLEILQVFLDQRIFKDYEWMFKSVKYDT